MWLSGKQSTCQCRKYRRCRFDPRVGKIPGGGNGNPLQYFAGEKSWHGQRSLAGYRSTHSQESRTQMTNHTHWEHTVSTGDSTHCSTMTSTWRKLGSIPGSGRFPGGDHGNPLQYGQWNPMDSGAWWAMVHRVAKSWTRLKWLGMHTHFIQIPCSFSLSPFFCSRMASRIQVFLVFSWLQQFLHIFLICDFPISLSP